MHRRVMQHIEPPAAAATRPRGAENRAEHRTENPAQPDAPTDRPGRMPSSRAEAAPYSA